MHKIPLVLDQRPQVGTWNTEELRNKYKFNEQIKKAWWYDFILVLTDDEFTILKKQFDELDKDNSGTIELKELKEIEIFRKRYLNEEAMSVLQPEFKKFVDHLTNKEPDDVLVSDNVTGWNRDKNIKIKENTSCDLMKAFAWVESEKMSLFEFLAMTQYIQMNICLFQIYDGDVDGKKNGILDPEELVNVMKYFDYIINKEDAEIIVQKMGKRLLFQKHIHRTQFVSFCCYLAGLRTTYQKQVLNNSKISFDGEEFAKYFMNQIKQL